MTFANAIEHACSEFDLSESAVRYYCRGMPAVFSKAVNARVWDESGNEYIDFLSACGSLNYGHNHPAMKARLIEYLMRDGLINGLDLHTVAKREFLRTFRETILMPKGMPYRIQFTGPTGTNAVEAALKLARKVTQKRVVVAFTNAFHGMSLGSLSVSGRKRNHRSFGVPVEDVLRLPFEDDGGAGIAELERFEAQVGTQTNEIELPAAFIVEAVQGEGGLNVASREWLRQLDSMAKRLGAFLIMDEIQAGCGRTGTFFSFEHTGIKPDLICLAKSIGGIGLPMALLLIRQDRDQWAPGEHNGTFRGNNLAFVAATAAIELWRTPEFLNNLYLCMNQIQSWVQEMASELGPNRVQPKGRGMMSGLAFSECALAARISAEAYRQGVIVETSGPHDEVVKLLPPLTIEPDVLEVGLRRLNRAISSVLREEKLRPAA